MIANKVKDSNRDFAEFLRDRRNSRLSRIVSVAPGTRPFGTTPRSGMANGRSPERASRSTRRPTCR